MTSEVMIMNRQAVVLAADSAVTYGGGPGSVVTLEAEKILQLGPNMALMVYSRGDVLGRSWSHIAHAFKRAQGELDFDSVQACADAFFAFVRLSTWCEGGTALPRMRDAQMSALMLSRVGYAPAEDLGDDFMLLLIQQFARVVSGDDPEALVPSRVALRNLEFQVTILAAA